MRFLPLILWLQSAGMALAQQSQTPTAEAAIDSINDNFDTAIWWLIGTAVAMIIAFYAVHRSVFPKK